MLKIYVAGPEVFLPNARETMDRKAELCRAYGFQAICPGDLEIPPQQARDVPAHVRVVVCHEHALSLPPAGAFGIRRVAGGTDFAERLT